jgi:hypothetical protein
MYRWWGYSKVLLHVGLGRRPTVDLRVVVDEGQVKPLFLSELHDGFKQKRKSPALSESKGRL